MTDLDLSFNEIPSLDGAFFRDVAQIYFNTFQLNKMSQIKYMIILKKNKKVKGLIDLQGISFVICVHQCNVN